MKIGIVGGGVLGLSLAYYLSRSAVDVVVFEGKDRAGGLLDFVNVDGVWVDKYYHCIMSGDADLLQMIDEIGLGESVRFKGTRQGVFRDGKLYSMASGKDFLLFPPLSLIERFRLGLTVLDAFRINDYQQLENVAVEDWLVRLGGRGTFEKLWKPMLKAKFDGNYGKTPATYIWSRLKRTTSTKAAAGRQDQMGYFVGSYKIFVERLVAKIEEMGSRVVTGARVRELVIEDGRVVGAQVGDERIDLDAVIVTTPLPVLDKIVPEEHRAKLDVPKGGEYLGVVCGLLLLDRSLTPYYTLNIADEAIPFTGIIETTNMIDPAHVGGYHLVYLPKYVTPDSPYVRLSDAELREMYLTNLKRMFPDFQDEWVKHLFVFRERFVEPLHQIGIPRPKMPVTTPIEGLFVVNNGQIYPELTNCQASVQHSRRVLPTVLSSMAETDASDGAVATVGLRSVA